MELDLSGDLSELKKKVFIIKEGVTYRIRIDFYVQREIVHGLKYVQKTSRMGVPGINYVYYLWFVEFIYLTSYCLLLKNLFNIMLHYYYHHEDFLELVLIQLS